MFDPRWVSRKCWSQGHRKGWERLKMLSPGVFVDQTSMSPAPPPNQISSTHRYVLRSQHLTKAYTKAYESFLFWIQFKCAECYASIYLEQFQSDFHVSWMVLRGFNTRSFVAWISKCATILHPTASPGAKCQTLLNTPWLELRCTLNFIKFRWQYTLRPACTFATLIFAAFAASSVWMLLSSNGTSELEDDSGFDPVKAPSTFRLDDFGCFLCRSCCFQSTSTLHNWTLKDNIHWSAIKRNVLESSGLMNATEVPFQRRDKPLPYSRKWWSVLPVPASAKARKSHIWLFPCPNSCLAVLGVEVMARHFVCVEKDECTTCESMLRASQLESLFSRQKPQECHSLVPLVLTRLGHVRSLVFRESTFFCLSL